MSNVFISYSRRDLDFTRYLNDLLQKAGRDTWVDLHDIPPSAQWQQEIYDAIDAADAFVFVLSPESAVSEACIHEVNRAADAKKRIIAVVCRDVDHNIVVPVLAQLNWIFFRPTDDPETAERNILFAIDTDLDYWHKASQLLVRAREWDGSERNRGFLLRGAALTDAERWLAEGAAKQPTPTPMHAEFIATSRRAANRQQRTLISALSTGLIITLVLSVISSLLFVRTNQQNNEIKQQSSAIQQQSYAQKVDAFAGQANTVLASGQVDRALLMDLYATKQNQSDATHAALSQALDTNPYLEQILNDGREHLLKAATATNDIGANVGFSADGKTLLSTTLETIAIYDMPAGKLRFPPINVEEPLKGSISAAVLSPDGKTIFTKSSDAIMLFDANDGHSLGQFALINDSIEDIYKGLAISPDGTLLASTICATIDCTSHSIALWRVADHIQVATFSLNGKTDNDSIEIAFSGDSKTLADAECDDPNSVTSDCTNNWVTTWDTTARTRKTNHRLDPQTEGNALALAFSPDSATVAIGGKDVNCIEFCVIGQVALYDAATLIRRQSQRESAGLVSHLVYTPNSQNIVADTGVHAMRIWNVSAIPKAGTQSAQISVVSQKITLFPSAESGFTTITDIAVSPDGKHFITNDQELRLFQWRLLPHSTQGLPVSSQINGTSPAIYTPDGKFVVTTSPAIGSRGDAADGKVLFWDLATQRVVDSFVGPIKHEQNALLFSPDGQTLAAGYNSGEVVLWDMQTKQMIGDPLLQKNTDNPYTIITSLVFSPNGHFLAVSEYSGRTVLWDMRTRQVVHDFFADTSHSTSYTAVFTDNNTLVLGTGDASFLSKATAEPAAITVWDIAKNTAIHKFTGEPNRIASIDFDSQTGTLATINVNKEILLWDFTTGAIKHRATVYSLNYDQIPIGGLTLPGLSFIDIGKIPSQRQRQLAVGVGNVLVFLSPTTLNPIGQPLREQANIGSVVVSTDRESLLISLVQSGSRGGDNPVVVYNLDLATLQASACTLVHRNFTQQEWSDLIQTQFQTATDRVPYETLCPQYPAGK